MTERTLVSDAIEQANQQQALASDPLASVFVSASAGSGKTKLLIDRLLRLMLPRRTPEGETVPGSHPARILCLTFTKAAAAEMAIRLQTRLGRWVTLSDTELDKELKALFVPCTPEARRQARALFADVLDLPGGMRIGTIHAFCQSLLRRFPLEAAMNPHFTVMEETDASLPCRDAWKQCWEAVPLPCWRLWPDRLVWAILSVLQGRCGMIPVLSVSGGGYQKTRRSASNFLSGSGACSGCLEGKQSGVSPAGL